MTSLDEGINSIKRGDIYAFIYLPYNFTGCILNRLKFNFMDFDDTCEGSPLQVWMDNSLYQIAYFTKMDIYSSLSKLIEFKCKECNIDVRLAQTALHARVNPPIYGENNEMISKVYPPFLNGLIFYMAFVYTSASAIMEKSSGVLERVQMNGMTTAELLTSNFIYQLIMMNVQNVAILFVIHVVFMEGYLGSLTLMYLILILNQLFGSLIGMLTLAFTSDAYAVNYLGAGLMLSVLSLNGSIWPTESIHWILKPMSEFSPVVMAGNSYSHIVLHGFGLLHPLVYNGLIYIIAWNVILLVALAIKIKTNNNKL